MAAITNPGTNSTEFSGEYKMLSFYNQAVDATSMTLTLTNAANLITSIQNVVVCPAAGVDSDYSYLSASFSDLVITITALQPDGAAADEFTGTTCNIFVIGK